MTETNFSPKNIYKQICPFSCFFSLVNLNSSLNQNSVSEHAVTQPQLEDSSGNLSRTRGDEVSFPVVLYNLCFHKIQYLILSMTSSHG